MKNILLPISVTVLIAAFSIQASPKVIIETYPVEVWDAAFKKPHNARELKKLFVAIAGDGEKLKELASMQQPLSTFLTQLSTLKMNKDIAAMIEKILEATKDAKIKNRQKQIRIAISELDPMCSFKDLKGDVRSWQKAIIALIRHARKFDICEWAEADFINAALKVGNVRDLQKILKAIAPDWYGSEMVSRIQEHFDTMVSDEDGSSKRFIDVVLAYEPARLKAFGVDGKTKPAGEWTPEPLRDAVKNRIKNPLDSDNPKLLQKILDTIDGKEKSE